MYKILKDFEIQTDHLFPTRRRNLLLIDKKKRTCHLVDIASTVDHRVKIKERVKVEKYLDLARELKKLWNLRVTVMLIVVSAHGTVFEGLEK